MKVLLDTDVLVAGLQNRHSNYERAHKWLAMANAGTVEAIVSVHSVFQAYRVLTSLPRDLRVDPARAIDALETTVVARCRVRHVGCRRHLRTLRALADRSISGGAVYDGLIAETARAARVDKIVTFNVTDFRRVAPDLHVVAP